MKHLSPYKIFEAGPSHWKEDLIKRLDWNRVDEIHDFLAEFTELGWVIPETIGGLYSHKINFEIYDSAFNQPGRKLEILEREFYQGYNFKIVRGVGTYGISNFSKEFFMEIVELLTKLEGYEYNSKITQITNNEVCIRTYHPSDIIDPSLVISDMKGAKLKVTTGIENAEERLTQHQSKIMNIKKESNKLIITQKVDKYGLDSIYDIINKTLQGKFNVILDEKNQRVIVASKGKWI